MINTSIIFDQETRKFEKINQPLLRDPFKNLIKVHYTGICGSDLYHYERSGKSKIFFGHEWIGEIVETQKNSSFQKGDWVSSSSSLGCGKCTNCDAGNVNHCLNSKHLTSPEVGALSTYLEVNDFNLRKVSPQKSSVLLETVAVGFEALKTISEKKKCLGRTLILGAGPVGILLGNILKDRKEDFLILEKNSFRIQLAKQMGLPCTHLKEALITPEYQNSFQTVIDCTSDRNNEPGGIRFATHFGALDFHLLIIGKYLNPIQLHSDTFARLRAQVYWMKGVSLESMESAISNYDGKLDTIGNVLCTHEISSEDAAKAFSQAQVIEQCGKVIIRVDHAE